jgi:hypothetical protein
VELGTFILYARDIKKSAAFYKKFFDFETSGEIVEGVIELKSMSGGANILIHQAAKSVNFGQVGVKLSFDVKDTEALKQAPPNAASSSGQRTKQTTMRSQTQKTPRKIRSAFPVARFVSRLKRKQDKLSAQVPYDCSRSHDF